jgi:phenylalanine-4-hydroxylase
MFAHQDFADFSQTIGLASLGASEIELKRLAALYWFTIEFGMCLDKNGNKKAYGAGIMSSFGELQYCMTDEPEFYPLDPYKIAQDHIVFPISSMQPIYFVAKSFSNAKDLINEYCDNINRPFNVSYNTSNNSIEVDRSVKTRPEAAGEGGLEF